MTTWTIQDVSRQSGLPEPTLRYYEDVGLLGPIARDDRSGHRRYGDHDLDDAQVLACLRVMGVGIDDMRTYQANRARGPAAAGEQRDILLRHAVRVEEQIATLGAHLDYLRAKADLWEARAQADRAAEEAAQAALHALLPRLEETFR